MMKKRVIAIIVTYNRLADLKKCVESLCNQTRAVDGILVVNNGSTDGTQGWLDGQPSILGIHQENLGGAGGFFTGIKKTYELGADYFWLMDDDGYPASDALEKLLTLPNYGPSMKNPIVIDIENQRTGHLAFQLCGKKLISDFGDRDIVFGDCTPFNGTLIDREVVENVGFPIKELFIWGDETEYKERIRAAGFPIITYLNARHYHPARKMAGLSGCHWGDYEKKKVYYYCRNKRVIFRRIYMNKYVANWVYLKYVWSFAKGALTQKRDKLRSLGIVSRAFYDGMTTPFPVEQASE
jgi:GT2 family glycosyltransferase